MIKLENVSYVYMQGGPFEKTALKEVNLEIPKGEFVGLIGHTGSGKSTLIQLLNGLVKPTGGRVIIDGADLCAKETNLRNIRFKVGLVMQYPEYQLFDETVGKDIAFGPKNMGISEEEVRQRVLFAANLVGLPEELLDRSPFELSGGQKRRAAIAGVLAMEPSVLILDEPTAGLDPRGRDEILYKIRDMHERMHLTVILVSHSMEDVGRLADRIVVMNRGTVFMQGAPGEVFAQSDKLSGVGLSVPQVTKVTRLLAEKGVRIDKNIYTIEQAYKEISELINNA